MYINYNTTYSLGHHKNDPIYFTDDRIFTNYSVYILFRAPQRSDTRNEITWAKNPPPLTNIVVNPPLKKMGATRNQ